MDCTQLLLQAKEEIRHNNVEMAIDYCTTIIENLRPNIENLSWKKISESSKKASKYKKTPMGSGDGVLKSSKLRLSSNSTEYDPVKFLSIGELTDLVTSPPGRTCSEAKFGKAFAIYGQEFACCVFNMVKRKSVPSLESIARWAMIELLENYCHNINTSSHYASTVKFDEGPDPVLFCPVHDSNEMRFDVASVYPTTTILSNLVRKFMQDLDLCHQLQALFLSEQVYFHTDLFLKQKILNVASYCGNWLDSSYTDSILKQHHDLNGNVALLYVIACLERAHCYFVMNQHLQCAEDCGAVLTVPAELPNDIKARVNLLRARSLYRAGEVAKEAASESDWRAQLQYLELYRAAAQSFAYTLKLMNENEFNAEMHECNVEMVLCLHEVFTAYRSDCQLKTCCLCWKNANLCGSHIFPRFILEKLSTEAGVLAGSERKGPKQVRYPMLCHECEQRFCNWGESLFNSLFFEKVYEQPSKKLQVPHGYWLYYFFASLIWRLCFYFQYKGTRFSDMLKTLPIFAMRRFLLSRNIQHLTSDCFLYLFIDKDVFDEVFCMTSRYKSYARRGVGCSFDVEESVFICYFFNYSLAFPVGTIRTAFLMQGSLKRLTFGEGVFEIEADPDRIMPVFLERFICKCVVDEYDRALSGISHQTHKILSRYMPEQGKETSSDGYAFLKVIRCLPNDVSVTFNPKFKYGVELQGLRVKYPPIDCELTNEPGKRYSLYVCEDNKRKLLALYHVYGSSSDHVYAFQFSVTDDGEISHFLPCENIRNKQYFEIFLKSNSTIPDFLRSVASVMILSETPHLEIHFFPEGAERYCLMQPDGNLILPPQFSVTGKPVMLRNMTLWLCVCEKFGAVVVLRLFSEIAYSEKPAYNYLVALQFHSENGKVKSFSPLYSTQHEQSETEKETVQTVLQFQSVITSSIELLHDPSFQRLGVVQCLQSGISINFFPITAPISTDNFMILNELGTVTDPVFECHSWLCTSTTMQKSCLMVLQKWKIVDLFFAVVFKLQPSEKDILHISTLTILPEAPYVPIFMKMVTDYCSGDFNVITRNIVLSVQAVLKVNPRIRSIFTTGCDPLVKREESIDESTMVEDIVFPSVFCLPSGCKLVGEGSETETLEMSPYYSLLCPPLKSPLYTIWLCAYKDIHDFIVVKTTSGVENVCSSIVVALNFVAAQAQSTISANQFRFYPYVHLKADEIDFVEEDFLGGENFQESDSQFQVLMACVQILLSQLYQSLNLQICLPSEYEIDLTPEGELQLVHPFSIAGPLHQETDVVDITCWLCAENLGMVKIFNKATECHYITALTFEYNGTNVSKLELVELPPGLKFLVQNYLYLERNLSYLICLKFRDLCGHFVMRDI